MNSCYQIYCDPENKPEHRQHVEDAGDMKTGESLVKYLRERLPKEDRVFGEFGIKRADVAPFDFSRMREAENIPQGDAGEQDGNIL